MQNRNDQRHHHAQSRDQHHDNLLGESNAVKAFDQVVDAFLKFQARERMQAEGGAEFPHDGLLNCFRIAALLDIDVIFVHHGIVEILEKVRAIHHQRTVVPTIVHQRADHHQLQFTDGTGQRYFFPLTHVVKGRKVLRGDDGKAALAEFFVKIEDMSFRGPAFFQRH